MKYPAAHSVLTSTPGARLSAERPVLFVIFFLSGAAGLVYEVLWLKELGLLFGNTAYAAAATLAVFFLGMAVGSWVFGRRAADIDRPLRAYAWLELGIAGSALLYFLLTPAFQFIYARFYPLIGGHLALATLVKMVLAFGILFLPAFLMGGTLPVMGQHLIRRSADLGRIGTLLYLINTFGAATGALLAGFALPSLLGFNRSYAAAIGLSCLVGITAWGMERVTITGRSGVQPEDHVEPVGPVTSFGPAGVRALAWLSGFLCLGLEVLWTRMFAQVLHNSVYSFTAILVTFLAALAIGSGVANILCRRRSLAPDRALLIVAGASWVFVAASPWIFVGLTDGLAEFGSKGGWGTYVGWIFGLAAATMLVPGILVGSMYPYLLKVSERFERAPGHTIGILGATNSVGGIIGSLLAGFVIIEATGLWSGILWVAAGYLAIAAVVGFRHRLAGPMAAAPGLLALLIGFALPRLTLPDLPVVSFDREAGEYVIDVQEGSHGTVAVLGSGENRFIKVDNHYSLGDVASAHSERTQTQLPLFILPAPRSVFFLGMGTGITAGAAFDFPVERVVTCELIPEVAAAARDHFGEWTNGLFSDPRSTVVVEDGRHFLTSTRERFDVIISDLFVPWHAGTGSLYTRKHFEICRSRLAEGGHFVQWIPAYQLSRAEFDVIARTVLEVFPHVTVWRGEFVPDKPTLGFVCSMKAWQLDPDLTRGNLAYVIPDRAPERVTESDVLPYLMYAGNLSANRTLFEHAALNTDDRPIIEYAAPISQQRAESGEAALLVGDEILALLTDLVVNVPSASDPFLERLSPTQVRYVDAGRQLYEVGVHVGAGRVAKAALIYREFLEAVPFQVFPGLESQ
jgi:spermidine synthase